jgi:hypothetical protein
MCSNCGCAILRRGFLPYAFLGIGPLCDHLGSRFLRKDFLMGRDSQAASEKSLKSIHPIARISARAALDCVIEISLAIAADYFARSERYGKLPDSISQALGDLHGKTGSTRGFPNLEQRRAMYEMTSLGRNADAVPLAIGPEVSFRKAVRALLEAKDASAGRLRRDVLVESANSFRMALKSVDSSLTADADQQIENIFATAVTVLRNKSVNAVFGAQSVPESEWPTLSPSTGNGSQLVERITLELQPQNVGVISQYEFSILQRLAISRSRTLNELLGNQEISVKSDQVERLMSTATRWINAADDLKTTRVIRAWKQPGFWTKVDELSRAIANPAGVRLLTPSLVYILDECAAGT